MLARERANLAFQHLVADIADVVIRYRRERRGGDRGHVVVKTVGDEPVVRMHGKAGIGDDAVGAMGGVRSCRDALD